MKSFLKQFGGKVTPELIRQYEQSENWYDGSFQNLEPTSLSASLRDFPRIIYKQLSNRQAQYPERPLEVLSFDLEKFQSNPDQNKFIWYGHSAILMNLHGKTVMIDPMLGPDTTPIAPMPTKRFSENTIELITDFPTIDLVLITHDHYDHLDFDSIKQLISKTKQYFVAMGVKRHLVNWGVDPDLVTELDWWDSRELDDLKITFTPTRHFSGRGITDRQKTLWGGWVLDTPTDNIWFSGDGGYGQHFKEVGKRLGPFDFAMMECGQYNEDWRPIHLFPDESVQAALDAGVKKAMPVHWGGFALSYQHTWSQPPEDFVAAAKAKGLDFFLPKIGEIFEVGEARREMWW